jgi:hypothetical protein
MSRISQSIAASLANRDKRARPVEVVEEDTVRVRPAEARQAPAPAPVSTPPIVDLDEPSVRSTAQASRPSLAPSSLTVPATPPAPRPWAQTPATPAWGQPEPTPAEPAPAPLAAPAPALSPSLAPAPSPATVAAPASSPSPVSPAPVAPAPEAERPSRLRRFWERSTPAPPPTTVTPTTVTPSPAPEPDLPPTQLMPALPEAPVAPRPAPAVTPAPSTPAAAASAVPSGHLGTVPRTQAPLPVPVEAPTPEPAAPAAGFRTVTPTSIKPTPRPKDRQSRKARLRVARVDPWSVMKTALLFGVASLIMLVVATFLVFLVIDQTGLYQTINEGVTLIFSSGDKPFDVETYINTQRAVGVAALVGVLDVVIITALATIFAALYNLAANVMGGIEITLAED